MRLRLVSGYESSCLAWFRDARLVGWGRLAGGFGHLAQVLIFGGGVGCLWGGAGVKFGVRTVEGMAGRVHLRVWC